MLVVLRPGGNIGMHVDVPEAEGLTRYHLVLSTNDRCWSYHDGDWQQLESGGIYTVDPTRLHASINWGESMRVHLVADVVPARVPVLGGSI
jgi:aspartyl/asparaginyl beta-hydroxylase (cupin superfamily)